LSLELSQLLRKRELASFRIGCKLLPKRLIVAYGLQPRLCRNQLLRRLLMGIAVLGQFDAEPIQLDF